MNEWKKCVSFMAVATLADSWWRGWTDSQHPVVDQERAQLCSASYTHGLSLFVGHFLLVPTYGQFHIMCTIKFRVEKN